MNLNLLGEEKDLQNWKKLKKNIFSIKGVSIMYFPGTKFNFMPQSINYLTFTCYENAVYFKTKFYFES